MGELPFVGVDRVALVGRLLAAYDEVVASGSARLVTLEAGSGWGTSRVVQELYRRLASERQTSGFWPSSILDAVPEGDRGSLESPGGRRKRVFPATFVAPDGALPEWLWWGISATARQGGTPVNALAADLEQVGRMEEPLVARLAELNPDTPWARAVTRLRSEGAKDVALESISALGDLTLGSVMAVAPPFGFLLLAGRYGVKHRKHLGQMITGAPEVAIAQADVRGRMVRETSDSLGRFAAAGIPVVVVLEDGHQADETLVDLLVQVLNNRQGPVLIVATAWPGTLDEEGRQAHRLISEVPAPSVERIRRTDLSELAREDRVALAGELLPAADETQRRMLAQKWSNPLALELGCGLQALAQLLEDGELTATELDTLPTDVDGLYRAMWAELPEEVRRALMLAVLATPATVSGRLFDDRRWDVDLPAVAAAGLDWLKGEADGLRSRLVEDATVYDWVRRVDEWLQACHEPAHHQVAADAALDPGAFSSSRRKAYYQALADAIVLEAGPEGLSDRERARARLLVSLAFEGFIEWSEPIVVAADLLISGLSEASDTASLRTIVVLADSVPTGSDEAGFERRRIAADACGELGQLESAVDRTQALLRDAIHVLGADDSITVATRESLAMWLRGWGRLEKATEQLRLLWESRARVLGTHHPDTMRARGRLARALAASGRAEVAEQAGAEFTGLLEDLLQVLGPDHPDTLKARSDLADALGRSGHPEEAAELLALLLNDRMRVLGADHPDTQETRGWLAHYLGRSGRGDEQVAQLTQLLEERIRALGEDHPDTVSACGQLALALGRSDGVGHAERMVQHHAQLAEHQAQALGIDHPTTLATRGDLAFCLSRSGRREEAVQELTVLLGDQERVFGGDHPDTMGTRTVLGSELGHTRRTEEALEQFAAMIEDFVTMRGADHPAGLTLRSAYAGSLVAGDRLDEASEYLDELLEDQERALGGDHPDTLMTRHEIAVIARLQAASFTRLSGQRREAEGELSRLLDDCKELLGESHGLTITVAVRLARWSSE
jgi:thioredoxin-like negative regulator of GroEL